MDHWDRAHNERRTRKKIVESDVFLMYDNEAPVGTVTLSSNPPFYYRRSDNEFWENSNSPAIYISGLAILPNHQGKGLASKLLDFAEETTREKGIKYVRFDAVVHYENLTKFYLKRGYKIVGGRLTGKVESDFFEKKIS